MMKQDDRSRRWDVVRMVMRDAGVVEAVDTDELAPPGMATRIVARVAADSRADSAGLVLWRRWCVGGAAVAMLALGVGFFAVPDGNRNSQFIPVPELETPKELTK